MKIPVISIVMPAHNVGKYIAFAIDSVEKQSFDNWELIIVDDCSTDNTTSIVEKHIKDNRIQLIKRLNNSGSAYVPREDGVKRAKGEWIINLDADDYIEINYLAKLLKKAEAYKVDIVGPQMICVSETGKKQGTFVPSEDFDFTKKFGSRDAVNLTFPNWQIGMNGALIKKSIWIKALSEYSKFGKREIHDDENLSRLLIIYANSVCFEKAEYYLRSNPTSLTKIFGLKTFGWMQSNEDLKNIISNAYGVKSNEYRKCQLYDFLCYKSVMYYAFCSQIDAEDEIECIKLLRKWHSILAWDSIILQTTGIKTIVYRIFPLSMICMTFKYHNWFPQKCMVKILFSKVYSMICGNKYYCWYFLRHKREMKIRNELRQYYSKYQDENYADDVVCIYDGAIQSGGLADRLKGIIGTYYIAKEKAIPFKLYFKHPFPIEDFLCPNTYDWVIDGSEICRDKRKVDIIVLDNTQDNKFQIAKQKDYLKQIIKNNGKQKHVYTNASFSYDLDYSGLFNELFKPSENLQRAINKQLTMIGTGYISISCRFLDLLGDFNETYGYGKALADSEKKALLDDIDTVVLQLHHDNLNKKILINSDSVTFLNRYRNCDFAYVIEGNITHIDAQQETYCYEKYEKTFLDFMMIANADKIYLIKSKLMHKSGFPYAASKIYCKQYEIIEI